MNKFSSEDLGSIKSDRLFFAKIGSSKLIISDGMLRSGSTLLFNILRLLLLSNPDYKLSSGWIDDFDDLEEADIYPIKVHGTNKNKYLHAFKTFYSYRDVRDVLVSAHRKFDAPLSIDIVRRTIELFEDNKSNYDLILRYEDMIADLPGTIEKVAHVLSSFNVVTDGVIEQLPMAKNDLNTLENSYCKTTLLHPGHVTGTSYGEWRQILPKTLQHQINSEFEWWFEQNNYEKN